MAWALGTDNDFGTAFVKSVVCFQVQACILAKTLTACLRKTLWALYLIDKIFSLLRTAFWTFKSDIFVENSCKQIFVADIRILKDWYFHTTDTSHYKWEHVYGKWYIDHINLTSALYQ